MSPLKIDSAGLAHQKVGQQFSAVIFEVSNTLPVMSL